jgi:transcriptional regulator with XRE-family HTH domain
VCGQEKSVKEIAEKLKTLRLANRMTLKELAKKAGCTDAYLSQLERGRANPSIMILKKVASALQVKVVDFFLENETNGNDIVLSERERVNLNFPTGDSKIQLLVRDIQNKRMQPFYTTIEPGGGSEGSYTHIGEEFGIVLRGVLDIQLLGRTHRVRKNESFYFSSREPHSWSNPGKVKTEVVWVVSPPTF